MSVSKRPNGSYQVTVCYGGRTLRKTSRHWTYKDAKEYERRWLASVRDAAAGRQTERSLAECMERWLTEHLPRLRSQRKTENHAKHILPFIAGRSISEAPKAWAEIKAAYQHHAPATINNKGRILRQICNMAMTEWGWTDAPVGKRIKLLPEPQRECFLTTDQVETLAQACPNPNAGDMVRLAAYTGIRRGHLMRLVARDHFDGEWLSLDRTSKNQKLLMVPVHPKVRDIAARLPLPMTDWDLTKSWHAARIACDMPHVRFHDLRHTCASWLVQAGVPLYTVSEFLGHSSVVVTRRYAHLAPENLRDAMLKMA